MKRTPIVKQSKIRRTDKIALEDNESGLSNNKKNAEKSPNLSTNMTEFNNLIDSKTEVLEGFNIIKEMYDKNQPMIADELSDELMESRPSESALKGFNDSIHNSTPNEKNKMKFVKEHSSESNSTTNKFNKNKKIMEIESDSDAEFAAIYRNIFKKNIKKGSKSSKVAIKDSSKITRKWNPKYNTSYDTKGNFCVYGDTIKRVTPRRQCRIDAEIERERKKNLWNSDSDESNEDMKKKTTMSLNSVQPELPNDYDNVKKMYGLGGFNKMNNQKIGELQIYGRDFNSLRGSQFLNDIIIDKYLELICIRNAFNSSYRKCASLSVFFPCSLERGNINNALAFFPENTFENELLFIPTHDDNHWYLFVVDFVNLSLFYYDSLVLKNKVEERRNKRREIFEALQLLSKNQNKELDWHEWKDEPVPIQKGPIQSNGSDCGVYVLQYADKISRNVDTFMADDQMETYRKRIIYELLKGELLPPSPY